MDSHEEILRRSHAIVSDSRKHVSRWTADKIKTRNLILSARQHIFNSQEAVLSALADGRIPFSWFKPLK